MTPLPGNPRPNTALAHSHPDTFGGGERAMLEVARGLARRGHPITLLLGRHDASATYAGLASFPSQTLTPLSWITSMRPETVILANSFGSNLLALRNGRRVAYWVHSVRSRFLLPGATRPDLLARRALDWAAVRRCGHLIANSQFTARRIEHLYGRPASAVVYPGVDLDLFHPGPRHQTDQPYAITVGRVAPEKGLDTLLAAWRRHGADHSLWVVGSGEPQYMARLARGASHTVRFLGSLPPAEVAAVTANAQVAVFTPRAEEFGIAAVEAMAAGVPVVALGEGGLTESVVDGETGYLAAHADDVVRRALEIMGHPALRTRLSGAARVRAREFTWQRSVDGIERVLARVTRGEGLTHPDAR